MLPLTVKRGWKHTEDFLLGSITNTSRITGEQFLSADVPLLIRRRSVPLLVRDNTLISARDHHSANTAFMIKWETKDHRAQGLQYNLVTSASRFKCILNYYFSLETLCCFCWNGVLFYLLVWSAWFY